MRLGGPVLGKFTDPEAWIAALKAAGYRAAYCPLPLDADDDTVQAFSDAAQKADIVIAEVGAWSNPLSPRPETRQAALEKCKGSLDLADRISARCCVNIAGSRGEKWDGPYPDDLTPQSFEMIVETARDIIDAVQPRRTFYTLETMPWMYPDSADSYVELIRAIDRPAFGVHLDPVNLISSPRRFFRNGTLIAECVAKLGPHIRSCHAKDIALRDHLTVHLDEVRPGLGRLDYVTLLHELDRLDADLPLMLEHLPEERDYRTAADYLRSLAHEHGIIV